MVNIKKGWWLWLYSWIAFMALNTINKFRFCSALFGRLSELVLRHWSMYMRQGNGHVWGRKSQHKGKIQMPVDKRSRCTFTKPTNERTNRHAINAYFLPSFELLLLLPSFMLVLPMHVDLSDGPWLVCREIYAARSPIVIINVRLTWPNDIKGFRLAILDCPNFISYRFE